MNMQVLDPTHEGGSAAFAPAKRLRTLKGARVGIVSNGKQGTKRFFDAVARELTDSHGVSEVIRLTKDNYSAPMAPSILAQASELDAIISGVGD